MTKQTENVDFSGLFKLDVLMNQNVASYSFHEVGLKKFLAFSNNKELIFLLINSESELSEKYYDWDFFDNPVYCMCFEPSGTWLVILSDQKVLLVPFLPIFTPQKVFDHKWSLSSVTVLPLGNILTPTSVVWWLTKESDNILILGSKAGTISFYSLETQCVVSETRISSDVTELQMCFDDSLDLLALLISDEKTQQWKLVLEHRSFGYNWLHQMRNQNERDKKDSFMSFIRQYSKDKITLLMQGVTKDGSKSQTVEYLLKPTEYLPVFRKDSNNWDLTAQYVNGRHFLTAFELNEGTFILEGLEEEVPSRTLRPHIKKDCQYLQGLWSQKLIYLTRKNGLEVHSAQFSVIQGETHVVKRDFTELWMAELPGEVKRAYIMSAKEPSTSSGSWKEPVEVSDLQLPRFTIEPCLVITSTGAYVLNTICDPCEWIVSMIIRDGARCGAELAAAALGIPLPPLLRAASDLALTRCSLTTAAALYSLSQSPPDGWVARLGVFGEIEELVTYKQTGSAIVSLGNTAISIRLLAILQKMAAENEHNLDISDIKITTLTQTQLLEISSVTAALGLWKLLPFFTIHRGRPEIILDSIKSKKVICRGALASLLKETSVVPFLLHENGQWLLKFLTENCYDFDTNVLKRLCLWLNPLQDQLRPVFRDLTQNIETPYSKTMLNLISTFIQVSCAVESRDPCPDILANTLEPSHTWQYRFMPRRVISCGLTHWAVVEEGNAKIMRADVPVDTDLIGRVITVACGRHHTLVLTENGVYSAGDNTYGQLGVGKSWTGALGDAASPSGTLMHIQYEWTSPLLTVVAGHYHSAAVDFGGRLYTWGWGVHGQLGIGSIEDKFTPQLVTKLQGRKVVYVGCGACHTAVLLRDGSVWTFGSGACGQLGLSTQHKHSLPMRVPIEPVVLLAVGYMHNLALTTKNKLYCWGSSPQQVRAAFARRTASPSSPDAPEYNELSAPHLSPQLVDITNVTGNIVQLAGGWHHSCILDNTGTMYTWGLNFEGQLGSGDRKQVVIPTPVKIPSDSQLIYSKPIRRTEALIACGGDFTMYVDDDGKVYATGNIKQQPGDEKEKAGNLVIMMKTTKRVIKIPSKRNSNKFFFQPIDRIDIMFPFNVQYLERKPVEPIYNPLKTIEDFERKTWADDIIHVLRPWLDRVLLKKNYNMSAKLAYKNKLYFDTLKLLLNNLKSEINEDKTFLTHTSNKENNIERKEDEKKVIAKVISERIKEISLSIFNEEAYPAVNPITYQMLPCCCDEAKYFSKTADENIICNHSGNNISVKAAEIIDKCIDMFPIDSQLWEECFRLSKDFYLENNLTVSDLENVLRKYMNSNASVMAAAIMYSNDCSQYSQILTPKFYLNMCSQVLDTWG